MYRLAVLNTHPIQYFAPLYRRLAREPDIDLTVYFCSRQGSEGYLDAGFGERIKWDIPLLDGYKHKFLKNLGASDQVGGFWSLLNPGIVSELRQNAYDALWVNGHNHATYLVAIYAAKVFSIPVFMRCETHLGLRRSALKRALRTPLMRILYNYLCHSCLSIGTLNREFYLFHGVKEDRLFMVPYAVDNDYFISAASHAQPPAVREMLGLPPDKPLILFASKLIRRKRPMDVIRAFHRLRGLGLDSGLIIVGSGEEESALKDYVRAHHVSDVYFFGFRNQSELPTFYSIADAFVFPSENESWGLVLNEVMCSGVAVVVARGVGAAPDLVKNGSNGFVYETGNVEELTILLRRILTSPEMRADMSRDSRKIIAEWNYERCVEGLKEALEQISSTNAPTPKSKRLESVSALK